MTVFTMFYSHSYLLYSYSHPLNVKNSIPFSQFLRLRRLCSYESNFSDELEAMRNWEECYTRGNTALWHSVVRPCV